jgi:hypothetical protein
VDRRTLPGVPSLRRDKARWNFLLGHAVKRIAMLGGAVMVSGLLFKASYVARELMMALAGLVVAYSAVLLLLAFCYLLFRGAAGTFSWVRMQSQHWNRASGEWAFAFSQRRPAIAKPDPRIP